MRRLLVLFFVIYSVLVFAYNPNEDISVVLTSKHKDFSYLYKSGDKVLSLYYKNLVLNGSEIYSVSAEDSVMAEPNLLLKSDQEISQICRAVRSGENNYLVYCHEEDRKLVLQRFDNEGKPLWGVNGKVYNNIENVYSALPDNQGGIFIVDIYFRSFSEASNKINICHINENGDIDWNKKNIISSVAYPAFFDYFPVTDSFGNIKILVVKENGPYFIIIDSNGNLKKEVKFNARASVHVYNQSDKNTIVVTQEEDNINYFNCYDLDGTLLWKKDTRNVPLNFFELQDGGFLTFYPINDYSYCMSRFNSVGDLIMEQFLFL